MLIQCYTMRQHLIALDAVLFDLVKLALELSLALQPLLSTTYIDDFPIELLSIHFINGLGKQEECLYVTFTGERHDSPTI